MTMLILLHRVGGIALATSRGCYTANITDLETTLVGVMHNRAALDLNKSKNPRLNPRPLNLLVDAIPGYKNERDMDAGDRGELETLGKTVLLDYVYGVHAAAWTEGGALVVSKKRMRKALKRVKHCLGNKRPGLKSEKGARRTTSIYSYTGEAKENQERRMRPLVPPSTSTYAAPKHPSPSQL